MNVFVILFYIVREIVQKYTFNSCFLKIKTVKS